jgi:hypothetical protein
VKGRPSRKKKPEVFDGGKGSYEFSVKSGIEHFRHGKFFGKESQWLPDALF